MKAVILAGGLGERMLPATQYLPKPMIPINGEPILQRNVQLIQELKIDKLILVVGYKKEIIKEYFDKGQKYGVSIQYHEVDVYKHRGIADALYTLRTELQENFIVILGDEVYHNSNHDKMLESFNSEPCDIMIGIRKSNNEKEIKKNYAVVISNNRVIDVEEKPEIVNTEFFGCGTYIFTPTIFEYIQLTPNSDRTGRKELTDAIRLAIKSREVVKPFVIEGYYMNINFPEDLFDAEKVIADTKKESKST